MFYSDIFIYFDHQYLYHKSNNESTAAPITGRGGL
jgi:hypothetical protein